MMTEYVASEIIEFTSEHARDGYLFLCNDDRMRMFEASFLQSGFLNEKILSIMEQEEMTDITQERMPLGEEGNALCIDLSSEGIRPVHIHIVPLEYIREAGRDKSMEHLFEAMDDESYYAARFVETILDLEDIRAGNMEADSHFQKAIAESMECLDWKKSASAACHGQDSFFLDFSESVPAVSDTFAELFPSSFQKAVATCPDADLQDLEEEACTMFAYDDIMGALESEWMDRQSRQDIEEFLSRTDLSGDALDYQKSLNDLMAGKGGPHRLLSLSQIQSHGTRYAEELFSSAESMDRFTETLRTLDNIQIIPFASSCMPFASGIADNYMLHAATETIHQAAPDEEGYSFSSHARYSIPWDIPKGCFGNGCTIEADEKTYVAETVISCKEPPRKAMRENMVILSLDCLATDKDIALAHDTARMLSFCISDKRLHGKARDAFCEAIPDMQKYVFSNPRKNGKTMESLAVAVHDSAARSLAMHGLSKKEAREVADSLLADIQVRKGNGR